MGGGTIDVSLECRAFKMLFWLCPRRLRFRLAANVGAVIVADIAGGGEINAMGAVVGASKFDTSSSTFSSC